jgi:hypothetical protein
MGGPVTTEGEALAEESGMEKAPPQPANVSVPMKRERTDKLDRAECFIKSPMYGQGLVLRRPLRDYQWRQPDAGVD